MDSCGGGTREALHPCHVVKEIQCSLGGRRSSGNHVLEKEAIKSGQDPAVAGFQSSVSQWWVGPTAIWTSSFRNEQGSFSRASPRNYSWTGLTQSKIKITGEILCAPRCRDSGRCLPPRPDLKRSTWRRKFKYLSLKIKYSAWCLFSFGITGERVLASSFINIFHRHESIYFLFCGPYGGPHSALSHNSAKCKWNWIHHYVKNEMEAIGKCNFKTGNQHWHAIK